MNVKTKIVYGGLQELGRELTKEEWQKASFTILLDENTFRLCLPLLISQVEALQEAEFIEVPVGEDCKCLEVVTQVWQTLMDNDSDRQSVILNLGGGSVCDLGGFVAAGYKRGIRYINVPTTLLSMVDASIGGKTAIDFGGVKNSIGHFWPSVLTVIEPMFLDTLPPTEFLCGQMEMVKTAAVTDANLYYYLTSPSARYLSQIKQVARLKNRVVKFDPYDHDIRKILNFGHTFGHAMEIYSSLPHGIAVGIGMKVAMYLSVKKLGLEENTYNLYVQWIDHQLSSCHIKIPSYCLKDIEQMLSLMRQDKKNEGELLRCVLLQEVGAPVIDVYVDDNEVRDALLKTCR